MTREELLKIVDEADIDDTTKDSARSLIENAYRIGYTEGMTEGARIASAIQSKLINTMLGGTDEH